MKLNNNILDYSICRSIMNSRCLFWLNYDDFMDICVHICSIETIEIIIPFFWRKSLRQTEKSFSVFRAYGKFLCETRQMIHFPCDRDVSSE